MLFWRNCILFWLESLDPAVCIWKALMMTFIQLLPKTSINPPILTPNFLLLKRMLLPILQRIYQAVTQILMLPPESLMLLRLFKNLSTVLDGWMIVVFEHCVFVKRDLRVFFRIVLLLTWCVAVLWNILWGRTVSVRLLCPTQWVLLRSEQAYLSGCFMHVVVCDLSVQLLLIVLPANLIVLRFQRWQFFASWALALLCWIARTFLLIDFIFAAVKQNCFFMNHHSLLWNQSTFFLIFFLSIVLCW